MEASFNAALKDRAWENANAFAEAGRTSGVASLEPFVAQIKTALANKKDDKQKIGGCCIVGALHKVVGAAVEPYTLDIWETILDLTADKKNPVAKAAKQQSENISGSLNPGSVPQFMGPILACHDRGSCLHCPRQCSQLPVFYHPCPL